MENGRRKLMFAYDRTGPSGYEESSVVMKDGYVIRDVTYASPHGGKVPAFLVVPDKEGPFPGIFFMHSGQGNRTTFLPEAEALAAKGVVSLLIDAPFLRREVPKDLTHIVETIVDDKMYMQTVVDIQRGIDLLSRLEKVDANRLLYVGHSFGATWGGVLAGVETRIKAYVLMAGFSKLSEWHRTSDHPMAELVRSQIATERLQQFLTKLEPLDSVHHINRAAPASVFFQFANDDEFISKEQAEMYYAAASAPKEMVWYETDHHFTDCRAAYEDRTQWILQQLGLAP